MESRDIVRFSWAVQYSTDQLFLQHFRSLCKIANLADIDLKCSGFISDVNIDYFMMLACLEIAFEKSGYPELISQLAFLY